MAKLFHGSKFKISELKPSLAHGITEKDKQLGVYATHERDFALLFTIKLLPNENGEISWSASDESGKYCMYIKAGIVDFSAKGYLYSFHSEEFEQIDEMQWFSAKEVIPDEYEIIDTSTLKDRIFFV